MTTLVPLILGNTSPPFTGILTLDGSTVVVTVAWNITGQRWYFTLATTSGTVLWSAPLVGSPLDSDILLAPGVFTTSILLYRADTGNFETVP